MLLEHDRAAMTLERGALVTIRRAVMNSDDLVRARDAFRIAALACPSGLVMLAVLRLDPRFKLQPGFDRNVREIAAFLREIDRSVVAIATVLEFDGVRRTALRVVTDAVWRLARPRCAHAMFDCMSDAAMWLAPHASRAGAADDLATYVNGYRAAEAALKRADARAL